MMEPARWDWNSNSQPPPPGTCPSPVPSTSQGYYYPQYPAYFPSPAYILRYPTPQPPNNAAVMYDQHQKNHENHNTSHEHEPQQHPFFSYPFFPKLPPEKFFGVKSVRGSAVESGDVRISQRESFPRHLQRKQANKALPNETSFFHQRIGESTPTQNENVSVAKKSSRVECGGDQADLGLKDPMSFYQSDFNERLSECILGNLLPHSISHVPSPPPLPPPSDPPPKPPPPPYSPPPSPGLSIKDSSSSEYSPTTYFLQELSSESLPLLSPMSPLEEGNEELVHNSLSFKSTDLEHSSCKNDIPRPNVSSASIASVGGPNSIKLLQADRDNITISSDVSSSETGCAKPLRDNNHNNDLFSSKEPFQCTNANLKAPHQLELPSLSTSSDLNSGAILGENELEHEPSPTRVLLRCSSKLSSLGHLSELYSPSSPTKSDDGGNEVLILSSPTSYHDHDSDVDPDEDALIIDDEISEALEKPSSITNINTDDNETTIDEVVEQESASADTTSFESQNTLAIYGDLWAHLRHGPVQSVKLLSEDSSSSSAGGSRSGGGRSGKSATVAFIDILSATKAIRQVSSMLGQPLDINYHEPGSVPPRCHPPIDSHPSAEAPSDIPVVIGQGSTSNNVGSNQSPGMHNNNIPGPSVYRQQRFPMQHGQSEDSSSHFYDQPKGFSRGRGDGHGYRGRRENRHNNYNRHSFHNNMDRGYRMSWGYSNESGRVAPPAHSQADERTAGPTQNNHPTVTSEVTKPPRRPDSPASTVSSRHVPSKRHKSRSVSESGSSDRGSTAGSRSRSGSRSSVSTSVSSGRSRSPPPHHGSSNHFPRGGSGNVRYHQNNSYSRQRYRRSRVSNRPTDSRARHNSRSPPAASPSSSTSSSPSPHRKAATVPPHSPSHSPSSSKSYSPSRGAGTTSHHHYQPSHRRPPNTAELHASIKIRNLPVRSSDTSLKDGLYHAYKQHGKVSWVKVIGSGSDRYAIVCFKSPDHAVKAVQSSQDKQFFGCKIQVTPYYTEESVGGTDEESRGPGEEESSFPTRTVLITSLDSSVTVSDIKSAFDQYDIVNIDIRKQGSSTHAVCEFLDIASAIRAKWCRHVFKSREARISFYRNPPTSTLLLDGTTGVTEKQLINHCCQYGAIKRVDIYPEKSLALVQYETISSAETAIRELGNWAIKGKKLDIDFASQECIRRFQERLNPALGNSSVSVCGSSSPGSNPIAVINSGAFKDGTVRKIRSRLVEYYEDDEGLKSRYEYRNDVDHDSKPMTTLKSIEESSPPTATSNSRLVAVARDSHDSLNSTVELHSYRRLEPASDSQRSGVSGTKPDTKDKFSTSGSVKIDLNCHEMDSAIVTSSSDIIAVENSDNDVHSNFTGSSTSGDEKVGSFEPVIKHRKSSLENMSSVLTTTTVDGVSSTSPEPKSTEIVSTSADPGVGIGTDSVARYLNDAVATDSQKHLLDSKVRRTSADSGNHLNSSSPECQTLHSNQEVVEKIPPAKVAKVISKRSDSARQSTSQLNDDSADDRPGTPLCDENPDGFETPAMSASTSGASKSVEISRKSSSDSIPPSKPVNAKSDSAEVSKVALVKSQSAVVVPVKDTKSSGSCSSGSSSSSSSSSSSGSSSVISGHGSQSTKKVVVSPTISPSNGASSSVMLSSTNDTSIFSPNNNNNSSESPETPSYSKSSTNSNNGFESSTNTTANTTSNFAATERKSTDDVSNGAVSSEVTNVDNDNVLVQNVQTLKKGKGDGGAGGEQDESASGAGYSSDSESGLSPRHSPTADSLEERVKNLCERYDTWDGNRKILKHTPPVSHSPLLSHSSSASQDSVGGGSGSSKADSLIDKIKQTIPQFSGTSDIGRTVLARKSIFDEDCERLVNFNEKYEAVAKPTTMINTSTNWKLPTLSRSASCSSAPLSSPFMGQTSPLAVSSNCVPPLSSPISSISPGVSFSAGASSKPPLTPLAASSPNYPTPSLSGAIVGKSISDKVKDLNANVTPQLNRSSSSLSSSSSSSLGQPVISSKPFNHSSHHHSQLQPLQHPSKPVQPLSNVIGANSASSTKSPSSSSHSSSSSTSSSSSSSVVANHKISNDHGVVGSIPNTPTTPKSDLNLSKKPSTGHPPLTPSSAPPILHTSTSLPSPIPVLQNNGPRAVERSLSIESRKSSPGVSTPGFQGFPSSSSSSTSSSSTSSVLSNQFSESAASDSFRPSTPRRISVDTQSSTSSSSTESTVSTKQAPHFTNCTEKVAPVSGDTNKENDAASRETSKKDHATLSSSSSNHHHHSSSSSFREKSSSKEVQSSKDGSSSSNNIKSSSSSSSSKKNDLSSSLKDDISSKVRPVHQETTVNVVASIVQTPLLTSRNEVVNTSKESSKKDKDKKRRASGASTPVSSSGAGNPERAHQSTGSSKNDTHSNQGSSTSSSRSSGNKEKEEKKERKDSKSNSSASNFVDPGNKSEDSQPHHSGSGSSSGNHHRKEKREKEKEHRENSGDRSFSSISKDSHSHKRDKDNKDGGKSKRRLSSQENTEQAERKKMKMEKESSTEQSHHHHRSSKSESNKDSRESTKESSVSSKEKLSSKERPEKESSSSSSSSKLEKSNSTSSASGCSKDQSSSSTNNNGSVSQSVSSEGRKEKPSSSDGKEREHHHKSKSSSSSSSSKHHSSSGSSSGHHQSQKSSRSSLEGHSSSTSSSHNKDSSSKDLHKKDREKEKSSGKENSSSSSSKSTSKHHSSSHASHSSSSSSKSKDPSSSSSSSSKNKSSSSSSSSRKERESSSSKPMKSEQQQSRQLSSIDSDNDDHDPFQSSVSMMDTPSSDRPSKSERSEKKDSEGKRDRHKSGGGDSSVGGDSEKKSKNKKEPKKRRRLVVEDSPSTDTDDDEKEQKHHSIFDVVLDYSDYYISMYDKVKRSNRACKNVSQQQKKEEEEQKKKQEKVSESLNKLKQSRAKREEKKRSTSIEERKSDRTNSSSDEGSHPDMNDFDSISSDHRRKRHDSGRPSDSKIIHSSDDEDRTKSSTTSSTKSKSKRKMKNKSSRKDEDGKSRKKAKRSNKSPSRQSLFSSSTLFSHSDEDSPASQPPEKKKKNMSSSSSRHQISSLGSSNNMSFSGSTKSSDESHSEPETNSIPDRDRKKLSSSSSSKSKSFVSFSDQLPNHQTKYNAQNIYSDSDSSDDGPPPQPPQQTPTVHKTPSTQSSQKLHQSLSLSDRSSPTHRTKSKDKSSKQKSRKQPLFDSTDSSDNDESVSVTVPPPQPNREKKLSKEKDKDLTKSSKSRERDKENKNKKKHRSHKSSSLKSRKQYYTSGDASGDGASHSSDKREAGGTATMEELFGPMTSSSDSDDNIRESDHERPKTPTVVLTTPSSCDDSSTPLMKPKSKSSSSTSSLRHERQRDKSPFSFTPTSRVSETSFLLEEHRDDTSSTHSTPHQSSSSKEKSGEKKKKKHHKEKRSKRSSAHEGTPLSSHSSFSKQDSTSSSGKLKQESVDYDALFNSPASSPIPEMKIVESDCALKRVPTPPRSIERASVSPAKSVDREIVPEISIRAPTPQPLPILNRSASDREMEECEKEMGEMFSSDDDEDDEKLKITDAITDAIRASADEQEIDPVPILKEDLDPDWKRKEEEEKKLNILVEQDKAIESIVLLERKSPTPQSSSTTEDEVVKDDIPKDAATISQEETDVAVATILETLGNEEEEPVPEDKPLVIVPPAPPGPVLNSPPTLRIIEDAPAKAAPIVSPSESNNDEIEAAIAAIPPRDNSSGDSNSEKEETRDEPDPWGFDATGSPKELQIDEGDAEETREEEEEKREPSPVAPAKFEDETSFSLPRSPVKVHIQSSAFDDISNSVDSNLEPKTKSEEKPVEPPVVVEAPAPVPVQQPPKITVPAPVVIKEEPTPTKSAAHDVYEFNDSDDDTKRDKERLSHTRQTPPMISPPAKSPVVPPPELKLQSPPLSVPMPVLQPQQPPPPPVVVPTPTPMPVAPQNIKSEPEAVKPPVHVALPSAIVPPQKSPNASAALPPPQLSAAVPPPPPIQLPVPILPVVSLPEKTTLPPPPPVVSIPPPPPIASVPCTPIVHSTPSPVPSTSSPVVKTPPPPIFTSSPSQPPPPPIVTKNTPPPQQMASRSTIDEAIDEVIRKLNRGDPLPFAESPMPAPVSTQPAQRAGRRSRSRSKDSPDENASAGRMANKPDPHRHGSGQVLGVIGGHQVDTPTSRASKHAPPSSMDHMDSNKGPKDANSKVKENLFDLPPRSGTVTQVFQSDDRRFVPMLAQQTGNNEQMPPNRPPVMHQMSPQIQMQTRPTPVISRVMDRDPPQQQPPQTPPGRVTVVEKQPPTPLLPHHQIPISKHEGLTAMLAQQQQQQLAAQQHHQQQMAAQQQHQQQMAAQHQHQQQLAAQAQHQQHQQQLAQQAQQQHQQQMAAQQHIIQRKPTEPAPYGYPPQPQNSPLRPPISISNQPPVSQAVSMASSAPSGGIIRPVTAPYGLPQQAHLGKVTTVVSSAGMNSSSPGLSVNAPSQQGHPPSPFIPGMHPGVNRGAVFVTSSGSPGAVYPPPSHQPQQIIQLSTNKPQERQSPRPSSRQTPGPMPTATTIQSQKSELVHLPEIPMATTVTKINAGEEQRKSAIMQPISSVVLTSTSGTVPGTPYLIRAVVSSPNQHGSPITMTQQQLQQHMTLQEAFRRSAEGTIRLGAGKDDQMEHGVRPAELIGLPQPQRVEIHGGSMQPPAHSPKPGRVPLPHEPVPTAHSNQQPRSMAHRPGYDTPGDSSCVPLDLVTQPSSNSINSESKSTMGRNNNEVIALTSHAMSNSSHTQTTSTLLTRKVSQADMRIISGHGRLGSDAPHYMANQPEHQPPFSAHYIPPNHAMAHQPSPPFGMRHEKPVGGIPPGDPKSAQQSSEQKSPAIIAVVERPQPHSVPPHLSSPHNADQRGADSPSVGAVFPGQPRQLYPSAGLPQQQHPTSQAISNMYAELDGRPYSHSPSYNIYDSRGAINAAAAAAAALEQEREQRPNTVASPLDPPYRIRSPPPSLANIESNLQGDSLLHLLQRYPIMWQGLLALKNDSAAVQMHFVSGSMNVARDSLPSNPDGTIPPLRISQRMRLEQNQLEGVARKLQVNAEHCMLLALPCGRDHMDVLNQSNALRQGFITYLQLKQAAGIVNICHPETQQAAYVIHIFPSCDFANENLAKIAPDLLSGVADIAHLLIVIATV